LPPAAARYYDSGMKAILVERFGDPDVMVVRDVPDPRPAAGQVLVRLKAAGVNPVETYQRAGSQGYSNRTLPFTPGADGAGVVEAVGPDVAGVATGDRVYTCGSLTGTYAEMCLCAAGQVRPLPSKLTFEQGACLWVNYGTAYRALFQRGAARPGDTVLVHGATGGVGIAAVQLAKGRGLRVIGTYGSDAGASLLAAQGVASRFDHKSPTHLQQVLDATGGRGVDVIVEMLANVNLGGDLGALARGGRVIIVGSRGDVSITPRMLMGREADVRGLMLGMAGEAEIAEIHAGVVAAIETGAVDPVIQERLPLAGAPRAHRAVIEAVSHGKVVLIP
jgi:NADPH:quinone reductase